MTIAEAVNALDIVAHMESFSIFYEPEEPMNPTTVGELKGACRIAISALRAQMDTAPNATLTLEELREMDGDKIYVHYIDGFYTDEDGAYFGKFEQLVRECNGRLTACELPLKYYGKTWLAYRRKPEEGMP